jgi:hypothetical protein
LGPVGGNNLLQEVRGAVLWDEDVSAELQQQFVHSSFGNRNTLRESTFKGEAPFIPTGMTKWTSVCAAWISHPKGTTYELPPEEPGAYDVSSNSEEYNRHGLVFAEPVFESLPHCSDLRKQREGRLQGNELLAAALARVVVLDDRVQSRQHQEFRTGLKLATIWKSTGIWVPEKQKADLDNPLWEKLVEFLQNPAPVKWHGKPDFLVLHLTILEALRRLRPNLETALDVLAQLLDDSDLTNCNTIIVTGRGVPRATIERNHSKGAARYLPISAVLPHLVVYPSKLMLMRALWSAAT